MKTTKNKLREIGIFNSHDIARMSSNVYIFYRQQDTGRAYQSAAWQVVHTKNKTDAKAHWRDHGCKTFNVWRREEKLTQLTAAMKWAASEFNVGEWERDSFGNYHPKGDIATAIAFAKASRVSP